MSSTTLSVSINRPAKAMFAMLRRHFAALLLICVVAAGWAWQASQVGVEHVRTSDTTSVLYGVVIEVERAGGPTLSPGTSPLAGTRTVFASFRDILAKDRLPDIYQKVFDTYLRAVYQATGDVMLSYRIWVFPLNLIFIVGAYLLFFGIVRHRALALALAIGSSLPIFLAVAGENFGIGSVVHYSRRHLATAFVPWLLWGYVKARQSTRPDGAIALFFVIGLVSNLHASCLLLAQIIFLAWLVEPRSPIRKVPIIAATGGALVCGGVFAFGNLWAAAVDASMAIFAALFESAYAAAATGEKTIPSHVAYLFYPLTTYSAWSLSLQHLLSAAVTLVVCLGLWLRSRPALAPAAAIVALAFLGGVDLLRFFPPLLYLLWLLRRQLGDTGIATISRLILATYLVSFVGMLVFEWLYFHVDSAPLVFNQLRGVRFLGFFVWVFLAFLLARIDWQQIGKIERYSLFLLLAGFALFELRGVYRDSLRVTDEVQNNRYLRDLGVWARENLPRKEKVFVSSSIFGIASGMEIAQTDKEKKQEMQAASGPLLSASLRKIGDGFAFAVVRQDDLSGEEGEVLSASGPYRLVRLVPRAAR